MKRRESLVGQVMAVNVLLVTASLFAATVAAGFDLDVEEQRSGFLVLMLAITATLLLNIAMLRRRFIPLDELIRQLEAIDPAEPSGFQGRGAHSVEEIERLAVAFERLLKRIEAERRRSGRLVVRAQEEERKRLARDLHDEVNQALTAILLRLEAISQNKPPDLVEDLSEVKRLANQAMQELLRLARQLRPTALDDHGLVSALESQVRAFAEHTGIPAEVKADGDLPALDEERETVIYRVAQEALSNAARHSGAAQVKVELHADGGGVCLKVTDDGRGFDPSEPRTGLGLNGMAERARLVGGELTLDSGRGRGTALTLRLP